MFRPLLLSLCLLASPLRSEPPRIATDIAPVQSLVTMVTGDLAAPGLVLPSGASPHDHALRPSEARLLQEADLVFWIGPILTPGLERPLSSLAGAARIIALAEVPGTRQLARREDAVFEIGEPDENHDAHGHEHGAGIDPHLWLDPANAQVWLAAIAGALAGADPDNAATYLANAERGAARIAQAVTEAHALLAPAQDMTFVAFHDAYHYFEDAFDLTALGAIALADAARPSPARLDALRDALAAAQVDCFVAEPQYQPGLVRAVSEGTERPVLVADPLGMHLPGGAGFYPALIRDLATQFASCAAAR